ncbi:MAG: EAL domain-containing protein [Burkholderiales bacterium]|nr:EAL domain-containing protein [Burkholderiales bacterium]
MRRLVASLGTRVARRVLALFLVCALLPVIAVLLLSYAHVQRSVTDQRHAQLSQLADQYGANVLERLLLARNLSRALVAAPQRGARDDLGRYFEAVAVVDPGGVTRFVHGEGSDVPPDAAALADKPPAEKPALRTSRAASGARAVWLFTTTEAGTQRPALIAARIARGYLWGAPDDLPYLTDVCVLDGMPEPLHCSEPLPAPALRGVRAEVARATAGQLAWTVGGTAHVGSYRELFLPGQFDAPSWTIVAGQPEAHALAPARAVRELVLPVGLLGLLIAMLLSLVQVRRTMGPLAELTDATKRIAARDFDSRVGVSRDDEFGELAQAFNTMSARLGRQFHALDALASIDAEILSKVDLDRIVSILLGRMKAVVDADWRLVLLAEDAGSGVFRPRSDDAAGLNLQQSIELPPEEAVRLAGAPDGVALGRPQDSDPLARPFADTGAASLFAVPIALDSALAGVIVLGYREERTPTVDEVRLVRDLGDRVAVALATAARDRALYRQAHYDALTQLPNRLHFMELFARETGRAERQGTRLALLFVDLDGFSAVNDTLGHAAGDELLVHSAARLRACVRKADLVARLGGDEFTILLPDLREPNDAAIVSQHVIDVLSQPFTLAGTETFVAASIGIALFPGDGATPEELLQNADMAMYRAKEQGRGTHVFFEEAMNREARRRADLDRELRYALDEGQFLLYYEPQLDVRTGRIAGAEALIRWHHPERGLVPPGQFIPITEDTGLIEQIGEWVLQEACAQFVAWRAAGLDLGHMSVNVSPRQFHRRVFPEIVGRVLRASGMPAERLQLEVTEGVLVDQTGSADSTLAQLVRLGPRLAIDDFGTGYSSLAYLKHLPVSTIKLDRSFIRDIVASEDSRAIARSVIAMVQALRKEIVAEGVETSDQLKLLVRWGCDSAQGYYLGRAMPPADFDRLVREWQPPAETAGPQQKVSSLSSRP